MKSSRVYDCPLLEIEKHHNVKGNISVIENGVTVPFDTKRVFYLYDVPGGESRGEHAHKELYQLVVAASGSFDITIDDGKLRRKVSLNRPFHGLLIVPGIWKNIDNFSSGSVCLVLASESYSANDYIRDYDEFMEYKKWQLNFLVFNQNKQAKYSYIAILYNFT